MSKLYSDPPKLLPNGVFKNKFNKDGYKNEKLNDYFLKKTEH